MLTILTTLVDVMFVISLFLTVAFLGFALAITGGSKFYRVAFDSKKHPPIDETTPVTRRVAW